MAPKSDGKDTEAKGKELFKGGMKLNRDDLPECCQTCDFLDSDSMDEYSPPFYYCEKNIWFPTQKKSCKKWKKYSGFMPLQ